MKVTYGAIVQNASGRFGGTVHSNWKGVQVVRRFAKPSNPNTVPQQDVRNVFSNLTKSFVLQPSEMRAAWDSYVTGKPLINRNAWLAKNVAPIAASGDVSDAIPTPGDSSTLSPVSIVSVGGVGQITTTVTVPASPSGWTLAGAIAVAVDATMAWNQAPGILSAADLTFYEGTDASFPYTPTITGLPAGTYPTWAFIAWAAPDGSTRYSACVVGNSVVVT